MAGPPATKPNFPYLGPGTDLMSPEEYQRVYKNYIQLSILLGYPFVEGTGAPCDHDLRSIFRQAGFFGYPVPAEAEGIRRGSFQKGGFRVEFYEAGGIAIQVVRELKSGALNRLILVNSSSPKATRKLATNLRREILVLNKDPRTGLETVMGVPVGYPHPLLSPEGQGLYVKVLRFNQKLACEPTDFLDNSWVGGFDLTKKACSELQNSVNQIWNGKMSAHDFAGVQVTQMRERALQQALAKGLSREEAQKIVDRNFREPLMSEVNVIGNSMRNLAQCNALALGGTGANGGTSSAGGSRAAPNGDASGSGSSGAPGATGGRSAQ